MNYKVSYAKTLNYEAANLRPALEKVFEEQLRTSGGVSGKRIMLKPNLLAWRHKEDIACVHPAVILETAKLFLDAGAAAPKVIAYERALADNEGAQSVADTPLQYCPCLLCKLLYLIRFHTLTI